MHLTGGKIPTPFVQPKLSRKMRCLASEHGTESCMTYTLHKANSSHLSGGLPPQKETHLLSSQCFRCDVSFREGKCFEIGWFKIKVPFQGQILLLCCIGRSKANF